MPKFLTNPGVLTKDRLKTDLKKHGIALPRGDPKKQVYVDLYMEHLTSQNDDGDDKMFSSDEEEENKPSPRVSKLSTHMYYNMVLVRK